MITRKFDDDHEKVWRSCRESLMMMSRKFFDDHEKDFIINAHRFLTYLLLKNQVASVKAGKPAKNFINPKLLLDREKGLLKVYLRKINELKTRARAEISEEYF